MPGNGGALMVLRKPHATALPVQLSESVAPTVHGLLRCQAARELLPSNNEVKYAQLLNTTAH